MDALAGVIAIPILMLVVYAMYLVHGFLRARVNLTVANVFTMTVTTLFAAAILFPVFIKAREYNGPSCASNMKQLGLGFIQYVQDYDNHWPGGGDHWAGAIYSYEKSTGVFKCPDDARVNTSIPTYVCSYAMSSNVRGKDQARLGNPGSTVLMTEIDGMPDLNMTTAERISWYTNGVSPNTAWGGIRLGTTSTTANPTRHDPSVMFLIADGHVRQLRPEKVSSGIDNTSPTGAQDALHAAGTKAVAAAGSTFTLTFSEK